MRRSLTLLCAATMAMSVSLLAQTPQELAQRAAIAAQISGLPVPSTDLPSGPGIEAALDLPPGVSTSTTTTGDPSQIAVLNNLGIISPRAGNDFVLLSSGVAGTSMPEPGTGFGNFGGPLGNDTATVSLTLTVPPSATTLSFDFRFFSAEFPDYVLAGFNDTFTAVLTTPTGTQQLAVDGAGNAVEVDSASFFPAFTSIAGGTGFDIFTPDPAGVNTSFPGGLPDAGLTDWFSASGSVMPGTSVTIVFGIADFGDDILDSAVLVDNLQFSNLEILDGDDDQFRQGNDLTNNSNTLAQGGEARVGICADGTARLLLRMNLPAPGTVNFSIQNFVNATESGALGNPGAAPQGGLLQVNSVNTPQGDKAFAVYRAPLDFVRAGTPADANARSRNLVLDITYTPQVGPPQMSMATLIIERPPVVLCHGLWSGPATWGGFAPLIGDARWDFNRVDYSNNNGGRISINRFQVRRASREARGAKNRRGIASVQLDWIGHSMGSLLARSFAATGFWIRPDNFGSGDLHKLVTVNTPHWGSPMANILVSIRGTFFIGDLLVIGMERLGMTVVGGSIDDLAEGSTALRVIGATAVQTHAIVGIGGSQAIGVADVGFGVAAALSPPPFNALFRLLNVLSFATTAAVYRFQDHDFIVLRASQEGGLPAANTTVLGGLGTIHTSVTSHAPAAARCIALLNAATGGVDYAANVPAPNLNPPDDNDLGGPTPAPPGQGISFTTTSSTVNPGAMVTIDVVPFGGFMPDSVLFMASSQEFVSDDTAPFSVTLTVPPEAIGEFVVTAIAINDQNEVAPADTLTFPVNLVAMLNDIELFSGRMHLSKPGQEGAVTVMGNFSDGIQRIVTPSALGTTYLTSDPSVATVSSEGVVTAVGEGSAAIIAQNGGFEVSLGAFVTFEADVSSFGIGCATTVGVPEIGTAGGLPVVGNTSFELTASNCPTPSFIFWALTGGPVTSQTGIAVPGAPACALLYFLPLDITSAIASPTGTGTSPLSIPANPSLSGAMVSAQVAAWDFALTGFGLPIGTSNALEITVGSGN